MGAPRDFPELPIKKPKKLEALEMMDRRELDSMPPFEVQEKVDEIALAVAEAYKKQRTKNSFSECVEIVSIALNETGSAIGGSVGLKMVAENESAAIRACKLVFTP